METITFLEQLNTLAAQEDLVSASREAKELRAQFEDYLLEEERKLQVEELEAQDRGETVDQEERKLALERTKEAFKEAYGAFRDAAKKQKDEQEAAETRNLAEKNALIKRLRELVSTEENIGAAFAALKEIQEKWKEIGEVSRKKRSELETEYAHLLDDFFYNIKIYKELKEHDFHRNFQLKQELITRLKKLNELESIKEIEDRLKELQDEWNDVGPVPNDQWEPMKESFWTEVRSVYNKINRFYEDRRTQLQENLDKKKALLEELKAILAEEEVLDNPKAWDRRTKKVLDIQERWKKIGFGPRRENDALFRDMRTLCDGFFSEKKAFFDQLHGEYDQVAKDKKALIEEAKALQASSSEDWKHTVDQLKRLQQRWKKLGHSGIKYEQKLWKEFRAVCDSFFSARQEQVEEQEQAYEANLKQKQEVLERIRAYQPVEDKKQTLNDLKALSQEFNAIGHVPMKDKAPLFRDFKEAMDAHYGALKMDESEKEKILFMAKIETLQASPDAGRQLRQMKDDIRREIDRLNKDITQLENNLGFFSRSKGAEALIRDVEKKVERSRDRIAELKAQLKMIPNE